MTAQRDEENDRLSAVVKWVAIASVPLALTAAVILHDWLLLSRHQPPR